MTEKSRFRKGMRIKRILYGIGGYTEECEDVIESIENGVVRTVECEDALTFDETTGKELENFFPRIHQEIVPLEEVRNQRKRSR